MYRKMGILTVDNFLEKKKVIHIIGSKTRVFGKKAVENFF